MNYSGKGTSSRDRKRCAFTKEETMLIINLWKHDKVQAKFKSTLKHNFIWEQLSRELNDFGYDKTADEIKRKIQNLKHEYKAMKHISEVTLKSWTYYDILKDLMEQKISEQNNVHIGDDHNYIETDIQELEEQSSSGSWMLMDIAQGNQENFEEVDESINTITVENLNQSNASTDVNIIETPIKPKSESVLKNPLPIFSQVKIEPNKILPIRRSRRPIRLKAHPERRFPRTSPSSHHPNSQPHSHVTETNLMEHIDEREKRINEREVRLEERERRIDERERRIDEREKRIEECEIRLRERERSFQDRDRKYEERETNSTTAMCRFFDTCAQFLNQYTSPVINQNCDDAS